MSQRHHHLVAGALVLGCAALLLGLVLATVRGPAHPAAGWSAPQVADPEPVAFAVAEPDRLVEPLRDADLLVVARGDRLGRFADVDGVAAVERLGVAAIRSGGRTLTTAAVAPASFRRWAPRGTAHHRDVWSEVARGGLALSHETVRTLGVALGQDLAVDGTARRLRVGALATSVPGLDVVLNRPLGRALGVPPRNAAVVEVAPGHDPTSVAAAVRAHLGHGVWVGETQATGPGGGTARLVGGTVATAVGSFSYTWHEDGTVDPDPSWVAGHIVSAEVPLLGRVTCHRVMVEPLRAALQEIVDSGLSSAVDASDYGGCYVPRFIGRDPRRGLSLHTWGIAVDLNVQTNLMGTPGTIDPRIVEIMERRGFGWGGRWRVPDPMHFELVALGS